MTERMNCRRRFNERRLRSSHNTRDETMEHMCNSSLCLRPLDLVFNTSSQPRREVIYTLGYDVNFVKYKINTSIHLYHYTQQVGCMSDGDRRFSITRTNGKATNFGRAGQTT